MNFFVYFRRKYDTYMIKNIALVAHDSRKAELMSWVKSNAETHSKCTLL